MMVGIMGSLLVSCTQPEDADLFTPNSELIPGDLPSLEVAVDQNLTETEINLLQQAGFAGQDVEIVLTRESDVSPVRRKYLIGGDMILSEENLTERADFAPNFTPGNKQYRYGVTVGSHYPTIRIRGVNMTGHPEWRDALEHAVASYNSLDIRHNLVLSFVRTGRGVPGVITNSNVISVIPLSDLGVDGAVGLADLPSMYGNPGAVIRVASDRTGSGASQNFFRHAMMHEVGHALGMHHTDWFDPMSHSCRRGTSIPILGGNSSPEVKPSPIWGVHIPGTPRRPNSDGISVFRTCHPGNFAQTVFSPFDRIALETIFPAPSSGGGGLGPSGCLCLPMERCLNGECIPL